MQSGQKLWEETVALYERATSTFLKNNLLLHFAYADFEEVYTFIFYIRKICKFVFLSYVFLCFQNVSLDIYIQNPDLYFWFLESKTSPKGSQYIRQITARGY